MSPLTPHFRAAILAASLLLLPHPSLSATQPVTVSGIRFWTNEEYTRVAVDLSDEARYEANFLPADPGRGLPPRVFIDLHGTEVKEEILRTPILVRNGLLKVVRAGRFRKGVVRVVVDLERESSYRVFAMSDPFRVIIDVDGKPETTGRPGDAPPAGSGQIRSVPHAKIRVMLDPGHGGKDPGAIGPTGLREKDVVLALGRMVRERLRKDGSFEVRMTRDGDVFVPLEERTAMANEAKADVFVSLHINASRNHQAEGISTYVLSRASDRHSLELAARENGVPVAKLSAVKFIIDDLSTFGRKKESLRLAKTVNDAIVKNVNGRFGKVQDLGLKQAPFYVLVGARMTAVLVESSFITNRREEARLSDPEYLATIADSVVEAIRYYGEKGAVAQAGL